MKPFKALLLCLMACFILLMFIAVYAMGLYAVLRFVA